MTVSVLMSTFNGERYVLEQVHSILAQLPPDGELIVRDDGSRDSTVEKIAEVDDPRIKLLKGCNLGFAHSFIQLLSAASSTATAVFFADQDDVWDPDKIAIGCARISDDQTTPRLYCSGLRLVSEDLRPFGRSPLWPRKGSFDNALVENIATGCTIALNRAAVSLVRRTAHPERLHFHDWWCYLVVSAFGEIEYDPTPRVAYRQHDQNALGMSSGSGRYVRIIQSIRKRSWLSAMQANLHELALSFGPELTTPQKRSLDEMTIRGTYDALRVILSPERRRQFWKDELLFRLLVSFELVVRRDFPFARKAQDN